MVSFNRILPQVNKTTSFKKNIELNGSHFFTLRSGYKLFASVQPKGDGAGIGTHVSVYAYLMKGENDDSLGYQPDNKCQYLKDDTLVFRVSTEASDYKPWLEYKP